MEPKTNLLALLRERDSLLKVCPLCAANCHDRDGLRDHLYVYHHAVRHPRYLKKAPKK